MANENKNDDMPTSFADAVNNKTKGGKYVSGKAKMVAILIVGTVIGIVTIGILTHEPAQVENEEDKGSKYGTQTNNMDDVFNNFTDGIAGEKKKNDRDWFKKDDEKKKEVTQKVEIPLDMGDDPWKYLTNNKDNLKDPNKKFPFQQPKNNQQQQPVTFKKEAKKSRAEMLREQLFLKAVQSDLLVEDAGTDQKGNGVSNADLDRVRNLINQNQRTRTPNQLLERPRSNDNDPNGQDNKVAFLEQNRDARGYVKQLPQKPLSKYEIKAGTFIPATLISGINSDLPGQIIAQVRQDVRSSAGGDHVLIPAGSKLIGFYDSKVVLGQERILVVWDRVNLTDGRILDLGTQPGVDKQGYAGVKDQVDTHFWQKLGAAFMVAVFSAGAEIVSNIGEDEDDDSDSSSPQDAVATGLGQQVEQLGIDLFKKYLDRQPTLKARPGLKFNVLMTKDAIIPINQKSKK